MNAAKAEEEIAKVLAVLCRKHTVPLFFVAFNGDSWWKLPMETSKQLFDEWCQNPGKKRYQYNYYWKKGKGDVWVDGVQTNLSQYVLQYEETCDMWTSTNVSTKNKRSAMLVFANPTQTNAVFSGQKISGWKNPKRARLGTRTKPEGQEEEEKNNAWHEVDSFDLESATLETDALRTN